jgi:hypothetical protein
MNPILKVLLKLPILKVSGECTLIKIITVGFMGVFVSWWRKFKIENFDKVVDEIRTIKSKQEAKIKENKVKGQDSPTIKDTLRRIDFVLNDLPNFKTILSSFSFEEKL